MASPITLRLDKETRARVARIAAREQTSASEVMREAIHTWLDERDSQESPYESVRDLLGAVHGGTPNRSTQTGRAFAALLKRRRGAS